ncbi:MAG TPA: DinB family protein [Actinomycetota bacterium]|jgi:hypothetical protein
MEPFPTPDPISAAAEYQRYLVGLVGDEDPAVVQGAGPAAWRALVDRAGDRVSRRPEPEEWSVLECLGHAMDAEIVASGRYRWILAQDEPPLVGYDQDRWVDRLHGADDDAEEMLAALEALRLRNLSLWSRSSPEDRARVGMHSERGPESYDLTFRMIAGHDRFHLAQGERALAALG